MSEHSQPVQWDNKFAWVRIFRAFRIALDLRKIILGTVAILLLCAGDWLFDGSQPLVDKKDPSRIIFKTGKVADSPKLNENNHFNIEYERGNSVLENKEVKTPSSLLIKPLKTFIEPLETIILQPKNWSLTAKAWTKLLYSIFVWSFFGLAISRMVAVQFARQEKIGLRSSLKFTSQKFLAAVSAPIIPLCGVGLFWFLGTVGGWVGNIPGVGELILGIFWFLILLFGLATALILVGLCLGWPMMISAIATEGSDGFDGFSRAYSYLFSRPWNFVWYVLIAFFYGVLTISLFYIFVNGFSLLSTRMISTGMDTNSSGQVTSIVELVAQSWNTQAVNLPFDGELESSLGRKIANYWVRGLALLCEGLAVSFFWTGATIVYFLVRRADDATDYSEVYHPREELQDDLLPLVGIADSEQPATDRPIEGVQNPDPPQEVDKNHSEENDQTDESQ